MGAFWLPRIELVTSIGEHVGYKSGLALTEPEITSHLERFSDDLIGDGDEILRVRSEEYEEMINLLLYKVGNIPTPEPRFPAVAHYNKYKDDPAKSALQQSVVKLFLEMYPAAKAEADKKSGPVDCTDYCVEAGNRYGPEAARMALEFTELLALAIHSAPYSSFRREEWVDTAQLADLFRSESLDTHYGAFFDQRFIDYLHRNFDKIDEINWRKFEGLTAEFFDRVGFHVDIGKGRNDDNIDVRVWPRLEDKQKPPTLLVQCKREKDKIGKVVVKALWADIVAEGAKSGLIVTTSCLAPGAEKVCVVRAYPINQANRKTLKTWVERMRSPNTGVFMGQ